MCNLLVGFSVGIASARNSTDRCMPLEVPLGTDVEKLSSVLEWLIIEAALTCSSAIINILLDDFRVTSHPTSQIDVFLLLACYWLA